MIGKKIAIGCDHAGFKLKEVLKDFLLAKKLEVIDFGTHSEESVDYADYAHPLADAIEDKRCDMGITICGSGNGITMTVNKHQGIRAALCWTSEISRLARAHNDANICSLPGRFVIEAEAKNIVDVFLSTPFEGGRHENRIRKISCK
jgi:ribose 5-phosphate isomerase B